MYEATTTSPNHILAHHFTHFVRHPCNLLRFSDEIEVVKTRFGICRSAILSDMPFLGKWDPKHRI
jgi:hypothetical protein